MKSCAEINRELHKIETILRLKERKMSIEERAFKGVWIPVEIWQDKRLTALDKTILMEIDSLDLSDKGCFASNQYLASFCHCTIRKITDSISKLIRYGYIERQNFDGRSRILRSKIRLNIPLQTESGSIQNGADVLGRVEKNSIQNGINVLGRVEKNSTDNTNLNNKANNIDDNKNNVSETTKKFVKPTLEEIAAYCNERGNKISVQHFFDYYEANGWKIGRNPMKDWKACIRTWESRNNFVQKEKTPSKYDREE